MRTGQKIRLKASSRAAGALRISHEAEGTVICLYRALAGRPGASERVDVRFGPKTVLWGAPVTEFEEIAETPRS